MGLGGREGMVWGRFQEQPHLRAQLRAKISRGPQAMPACSPGSPPRRWGPHLTPGTPIRAGEPRAEREPQAQSPSISTRTTSLRMVKVVPRTRMEKRKVQMGSTYLYSGCRKKEGRAGVQRLRFPLPSLPALCGEGGLSLRVGVSLALRPCVFCAQKDRHDRPQFKIRHSPFPALLGQRLRHGQGSVES